MTSLPELLRLLELDASSAQLGAVEPERFPLLVPRPFIWRMRKGDPHDPLLRQVLPLAEEQGTAPGDDLDPVGDLAAEVVPGVLRKYEGRALLVTTGACAVHCRYCFRRHFPYSSSCARNGRWRAALDCLASDPSITEVILSGGDPLTLPDAQLAELADRLSALPHIERLRVHTRLPVVLPQRVEEPLIAWLTGTRLAPVLVVQANHAAEIDAEVCAALQRLRGAGVTLLNQSVLLKGVNDSVTALAALSERLFAAGVLPYYLHMLDPVAGAGHFAVEEATARGLMQGLRARLPGYLVPRLVREQRGAPAKLPL